MASLSPRQCPQSSVCLEGQFHRFVAKSPGQFLSKYLEMTADNQVYRLKLAKPLRRLWGSELRPGDRIRVSAQQRLKSDGRLKLKAYELVKLPAQAGTVAPMPSAPVAPGAKAASPGKVLICQQSSCRKRGAQGVCTQMAAALAAAGLEPVVQIQPTGCMDRCKAGPQLVIMPGKARYSRVRPDQVAALVQQHFCSPERPPGEAIAADSSHPRSASRG